MLQPLEPRRLLAGSVHVARGVLRIQGTDGDDVITLTQLRGVLTATLNGAATNVDASTVRRIGIEAGAGNDTVILQNSHAQRRVTLPARVQGGDGDDFLIGGDASDTLGGESGLDTVNGGLGNDQLSGDFVVLPGEPVPTAALSADGQDVVIGGGGDDSVSYALRVGTVVIQPTDGVVDSESPEDDISGVDNFTGGQGDDVMLADLATQVTLNGGGGNDSITINSAGSVVTGGVGDDTISGAGASADIDGGDGSDTISTSGNSADIRGDAGNDFIATSASNENVSGGDGDDVINVINAFANGGAGNDSITGDGHLDSGGGRDTLVGGSLPDTLVLSGNTRGFGNGGNDVFLSQGTTGNSVDGGDGFDIIDNAFATRTSTATGLPPNVEFALDNGSASVPASATIAVHARAPRTAVLTSTGGLFINGTAAADTIALTQANGNIVATVNGVVAGTFAAGDITAVTVDAGAGSDSVDCTGLALTVGARIKGGDGNDVLLGSAAGDNIEGDAGNDTLNGEAGNDVLSGDYIVLANETAPRNAGKVDGDDIIDGGGGDTNVLVYSRRTDAVTVNLSANVARHYGLGGGPGERDVLRHINIVAGGRGNDVLTGSAGSDVLFGGAGDDTLGGGEGNDALIGQSGTDSLQPDGGNDFLTSGPDASRDRINARVSAAGYATDVSGDVLFGTFDRRDYFVLSGKYFAAPAAG